MSLFSRNKNDKHKNTDTSETALKMVMGDETREVSFNELVLSNNLAQQALVRLLINKKVIEPDELMDMMETVRKDNYRSPEQVD
jgi:hypothetical protein